MYCLSLDLFTVNEKGVLKLNMPLDFESVDYFEFMMIAVDSGTVPRSGSAIVNVTVIDSNDNSPIFQFPPGPGYSLALQVPEGNYSIVNHLLTNVSC